MVATAWKADVNDMAKASYANFNNLHVPIDQTTLAFDAMAVAGQQGGFELKDMAQYFPMLTGRLQSLGQKGVPAVADLSAALQVAFQDTGEAEQAATNIKNLLISMNSQRVETQFKKIGVDLPKALKKAYKEGKTPLEAIADLVKKTTKGDLSKVGHLFTNQEASAALLSLIQHYDAYKKIRSDANAGGGANQRAFNERVATDPSARLARFRAQLERLEINLGNRLLPAVNKGMEKIGALADRFGAWADAHPKMASALMKLAAALAVILVVFGALAVVGGTLIAGWGVMTGIFSAVWAVLVFGFGIIASLLGAIATLVGLPFIVVAAIAAALVVAGIAIYKYWDQIKSGFASAWHWLEGLVGQMATIGVNLVQGIINGIGSMFGALKAKIVSLGKGAVNWFKGVLGIHSPSRVFMQLGGHMTNGLAIGVDRGAGAPLASIGALANRATARAAMIAASIAASAAPAAAAAGPSTSGVAGSAQHYHHHEGDTFHIHLPPGGGGDMHAMARQLLAEIERIKGSRRRAEYEDD